MKVPKRVRWDVRVLVARLTMFGPRGCLFRQHEKDDLRPKHFRCYQWMRQPACRDTFRDGTRQLQAVDCWKHKTFVRAIELGLVRARPNRDATDPINGGFFPLTVDSRVRLQLTELGRAAYTVWCLQNADSVDINASG